MMPTRTCYALIRTIDDQNTKKRPISFPNVSTLNT